MKRTPPYQPPCTTTPAVVRLVAEICERLGRLEAGPVAAAPPRLRRESRIKAVHASLGIEGGTMTIEQVTALSAGRRILGQPREVQEVRNALEAYEQVDEWQPSEVKHLLRAHGLLMKGLVDDPGVFRRRAVGIRRGGEVIHIAPPPAGVHGLVKQLLDWLDRTPEHPLVAGCVFHHEFEFIHPFSDGNGRLGRLWHSLLLRRWKPLFAGFPVESIVRERQAAYYAALSAADAAADAGPFVEFMLAAVRDALRDLPGKRSQKSSRKSSQIILAVLARDPSATGGMLARRLGISERAVKKRIAALKEKGLLRRIGPDRGGRWEVVR